MIRISQQMAQFVVQGMLGSVLQKENISFIQITPMCNDKKLF